MIKRYVLKVEGWKLEEVEFVNGGTRYDIEVVVKQEWSWVWDCKTSYTYPIITFYDYDEA